MDWRASSLSAPRTNDLDGDLLAPLLQHSSTPLLHRSVAPKEFDDGLCAGLDMELFVHGMEVSADGAQGNAQKIGDLLVKLTLGQQSQDFMFALGQTFNLGRWLFDLLEVIDDFAGDLHRHRR